MELVSLGRGLGDLEGVKCEQKNEQATTSWGPWAIARKKRLSVEGGGGENTRKKEDPSFRGKALAEFFRGKTFAGTSAFSKEFFFLYLTAATCVCTTAVFLINNKGTRENLRK